MYAPMYGHALSSARVACSVATRRKNVITPRLPTSLGSPITRWPVHSGHPGHARYLSTSIIHAGSSSKDTTDSSYPFDLAQLRRVVDEAKITSRGNDKLIDWTTIAEQHFPGADPFDLLYLYEHGDTDHSTDVRGSGKRTSASTAGSVKDVSAAKQQSAVFTKEQNARILEFFARHRSHSAHFTSAEIDTRALQEFVGTTKPRHVIIQHYHNLNYWRPWTPEDDARLLDAYNAGKPLVDVAAELERITANVRQRIDLLLRDDTEDAERGSKRLGKFGSIFVRRQFQVCGPDWGSLQLMTGVKTKQIRETVASMPHYWYAVPMQRYLDRVELELFHKWTDDQRSQLLQVVDQHLARPDVRGSLDKIDWYEVAFHMKHSRNSCCRTYENLQHNRLRTGFFSPEEDRALLREWLDHGYKNMNFERALPNRARNAYPVQRLQRLLNGFVRGKPNDIGFQLCSELGVSLDQASAHMTRNRKPK